MDEQQSPVPTRPAATIILAREQCATLEIYLLKRSAQSGFMGGLYVFPGGVVEDEDRGMNAWKSHVDLPPDQITARLGSPSLNLEDTLGFIIAAIRETLEEAGVLVANAAGKTRMDFEQMCRCRLEQDRPADWFRQKVMEENWTLSLSRLGRWSHWITPRSMKKRFDTRFFIVSMPDNQVCMPDDMETKDGIWLSPQSALEQNLAGRTPLSPPTIVTLTQLLVYLSLDDLKTALASKSWGQPIVPGMIKTPEGPVILEPWDPQYENQASAEATGLQNKVLPAGADFSRIWCDNGIWKPVRL